MRSAALFVAATAALLGAPAQGAPVAIALISARPSAAASELARELESSGFLIVPAIAPGAEWQRAASGPELSVLYDGVILDDDGSSVRVFRRPRGHPPRVVARLAVDQDDALARRRTWLAVVEQLRLPAPPPLRAAPTELVATVSPVAAALRPGPFALGAATVLGLATAVGEPTAHLQLSWLVPIASGLSFQARALWPLVGAQLQTADGHVRAWTFGAAAGVHQLLAARSARWRPFVGATAGSRVLLADLTDLQGPSSRTRFTPTVAVAGQLGVRVQVRPLVDLFAEAELGYGWAVGAGARTPIEEAAATGRAAQVALGVLFGY